jgi:CO/xanthine dehydrogenase Mo-binding subunit
LRRNRKGFAIVAAPFRTVGKRTKRIDSPPKLTGAERFTADLRPPGLLFSSIVGSTYAHATITNVDTSAALDVPGVVAVLTDDDLPIAKNENGEPLMKLLAGNRAVYVGQPIALVLAESAAAAQDGADAVIVDYEEQTAVSDLEFALSPDSPSVNEDAHGAFEDEAAMHNADAAAASGGDENLPVNVTNSINFERGDVDKGFAESDAVVELSFESETVHQGYIETQSTLAIPDMLGRITVHASTQAAFHVRQKVADTLGYPASNVTVIPMPVGGGFGGKFGHCEPIAAAAAVAVDRPVLLQYTRSDDMLAGNPAPDCKITVKLGATKDGTIKAIDAYLLYGAGSSAGSPLGIAAILLGGYYKFPHLRIKGHEVLTHHASAGAYRAPGAQQASFAIESAVDELAAKLGIDPMEFRLHNAVEEGDLRPTGGGWPKIGMKETLEAVKRHPLWANRSQNPEPGRGIGIAVGGWPGAVEPATATCRLDADGKLTVVLGTSDLNGTNTSFAQVAAESFGLDIDDVRVSTVDTDSAPFAPGAGGSKITYSVAPAVHAAAQDALEQIKSIAADHLEASVDDLEVSDGMVRVKGVPGSGMSLKEVANLTLSSSNTTLPVYGRGSASLTQASPGFAVHLAEVKVDELTGEVQVLRYVAAQDVGFAINPAAVEGQIHGGVAQGIGWALYEGQAFDSDGAPQASTLMDYALPRSTMVPEIEVILVEVASPDGQFGAKGVGEPPAIPGAATIANAIRAATGARVTHLPIRAADVLDAITGD